MKVLRSTYAEIGALLRYHHYLANYRELKESLRTYPWWVRIILIMGSLFAICNLGRAIYFALMLQGDLEMLYENHYLPFWHRQPSVYPYHPITCIFLAPIFLFGIPAAKVIVLLLNLGSIIFIWRRLSAYLSLNTFQQWLFLVLFCDWACVRIAISQNQLSLIVITAILYLITSQKNAPLVWLLTFVKYSIPLFLYLWLLLKQPRKLVIPITIMVLLTLGCLWWLRLDPVSYLKLFQEGTSFKFNGEGHTDIVHWLGRVSSHPWTVYLLLGGASVVTFFVFLKQLKEELTLVSALLILSLLLVYHRFQDLVVLAPVFGLVIREARPGWAVIMTVYMAGWCEKMATGRLKTFPDGPWSVPLHLYYPVLLVVLLVFLIVRNDNHASTKAHC